jgi:hypothetical protein
MNPGVGIVTSPASPGVLGVQRLNPDDPAALARWDAFVEACPEATFFHKSGWQRILREVFGHRTHFLFAERAGVIEGYCRWHR